MTDLLNDPPALTSVARDAALKSITVQSGDQNAKFRPVVSVRVNDMTVQGGLLTSGLVSLPAVHARCGRQDVPGTWRLFTPSGRCEIMGDNRPEDVLECLLFDVNARSVCGAALGGMAFSAGLPQVGVATGSIDFASGRYQLQCMHWAELLEYHSQLGVLSQLQRGPLNTAQT